MEFFAAILSPPGYARNPSSRQSHETVDPVIRQATVSVPASVTVLSPITVTAHRASPLVAPIGFSPDIERLDLPQTIASIGRQRIEDTVNFVDVEDALRYLPSLFVRKRNNGDTQATLETRAWGVNSSARSLVYVDDVPISALISNNNTDGAPRWGMVSPEEIAGIDVLYGPYAAEYAGNSMGGVVLITTRTPRRFRVTAEQTGAVQSFDMYRTRSSFGTLNTAATVGDKMGRFSLFLSGDHENSFTQPLLFVTHDGAPAGTTGTIPAQNKTGETADVVGAGGLVHRLQNTLSGRFTFDLTRWLRAAYMIGYWDQQADSSVQTYLRDDSGNPSFGGVSGFARGRFTAKGRQLMNALSLKTDTQGAWDWEAVVTRYDYLEDIRRSPAGVTNGENFTTDGYIARMDGTGWSTEDLKGIWRPAGVRGAHQVSFGVHHDHYTLENPTYDADNWEASPDDGNGTLHSDGRGKTETYALWAQDAWKFARGFKLTLGGRLESWRAWDGFNQAGDVAVAQPSEHATDFSPKATLAWQIDTAWSAKFSFGEAYRYPTVSELYQIVSTGDTFAVPNPDLAPEHVYAREFAVAWDAGDTRLRLSLFQQNTKNALISQTTLINGAYTRTVQNVAEVRNRGVEFVAEQRNAFVPGLDLSNSLTFVDSRILSDPGFESPTGATATGKRVPYVPRWRDTLQATYRPNDRLAVSVAARYQSKVYSTMDNTDTVPQVFGAFDRFLVVDLHFHYRINDTVSLDVGINNLFDEKYFEYHPFPMRTYVAKVQLDF